jgi:hypothetical protein
MSLTKDFQHTRSDEIKAAASSVFSGPDALMQYHEFSKYAFQWPNGSERKPSGQYIRRLIDKGYRPSKVADHVIDDLEPLLTPKNISFVVDKISQTPEYRRWLIEHFFQETLDSLSNQQLGVLSIDLIGEIFSQQTTPEQRATILCLGLGKEQLYDGLVSYSLSSQK